MRSVIQERFPADSDRVRQPQPEPERIELHAYTISTNPGLDCARAWIDCNHGPDCPYRACVARLYESEVDARKAVPHYMLEQIFRAFDQYESALSAATFLERVAEFPRYRISRLDGYFQGRDYQRTPCRLEDPYRRLAWGDADDRAWRTVRRHKDRYDIAGALLPIGLSDFDDGVPPTASSSLFLFRSGFGDLEVTEVATIRGSIPA